MTNIVAPSDAKLKPQSCTDQALPRRHNRSAYRCSLPGLTGFTGVVRAGPNRCSSVASRAKMAEGEGFEPSRQVLAHQHAFQACALNRSATPPSSSGNNGGEGGIRTHETGFDTAYPISSRAPSTNSDTSPHDDSFSAARLEKLLQKLGGLVTQHTRFNHHLMIQSRVGQHLVYTHHRTRLRIQRPYHDPRHPGQ